MAISIMPRRFKINLTIRNRFPLLFSGYGARRKSPLPGLSAGSGVAHRPPHRIRKGATVNGSPLRFRVLYYIKTQLSPNSIHFRVQNCLLPNFQPFFAIYFCELIPIFRHKLLFLRFKFVCNKNTHHRQPAEKAADPPNIIVYFCIIICFLLHSSACLSTCFQFAYRSFDFVH